MKHSSLTPLSHFLRLGLGLGLGLDSNTLKNISFRVSTWLSVLRDAPYVAVRFYEHPIGIEYNAYGLV